MRVAYEQLRLAVTIEVEQGNVDIGPLNAGIVMSQIFYDSLQKIFDLRYGAAMQNDFDPTLVDLCSTMLRNQWRDTQ